MTSQVFVLITGLQGLRDAFANLGRWSALGLLGDGRFAVQLRRARDASLYTEQAAAIQRFITRQFGVRGSALAWPDGRRPDELGVIKGGAVDVDLLDRQITSEVMTLSSMVSELAGRSRSTGLLEPIRLLMDHIGGALPASSDACLPDLAATARKAAPCTPARALLGPPHLPLDPAFVRSFSLRDCMEPRMGQSDVATVFHFWCLAMHEALAAALCALSLSEYDGMPLDFYCDMAKQAWDEMRHARFFFDTAVELLPVVEQGLVAGNPLREAVRRFRATGSGLPVPQEGSLYEAIWNADLAERLILMQINTESAGVAGLRRQMQSDFCQRHPRLRDGLDVVAHDEVFHARLGRTWLEHLLPGRAERDEAMERAALLRSPLLLTSFVHHGGGQLGALMKELQAGPIPAAGKPVAYLE